MRNQYCHIGSVGTVEGWSFDGMIPSNSEFSGERPISLTTTATAAAHRPIRYGECAILETCCICDLLLAGGGVGIDVLLFAWLGSDGRGVMVLLLLLRQFTVMVEC